MEDQCDILIHEHSLTVFRFAQCWPAKGRELENNFINNLKFLTILFSGSVLFLGSFLHLIYALIKRQIDDMSGAIYDGAYRHLIEMVKKSQDDDTSWQILQNCGNQVVVLTISGVIYHVDYDISEDLTLIFATASCTYTIIVFQKRRHKFVYLFTELSDFEKFGKPPEFDKTHKRMNLLSKVFHNYCIFACVVYASLAKMSKGECVKKNEEKGLHEICGLMAHAWFPFSIDTRLRIELLFLSQLYSAAVILPTAGLICYTQLATSQHFASRIHHLRQNIVNVINSKEIENKTPIFYACIRYHQYIINLQKHFASCYSDIMFNYFLATSLTCGCLGNQVIRESSFYGALSAAVHGGGWLFNLVVICHGGQILMDASSHLADVISDIDWNDCDTKLQKDIMMFALRSQRLLQVPAGPLGYLTHEQIITVLRTGYSYMTLLSQS